MEADDDRYELWLTAFHESGHAVTATYFNWEVKHVTIAPDRQTGFRGSCLHWMPPGTLVGNDAETDALIALSGPMAEAIFRYGSLNLVDLEAVNCPSMVASVDYTRAQRRIMKMTRGGMLSPESSRGRMIELAYRAAGILRNPILWAGVERLALSLMEFETLFSGEVGSVLAGKRLARRSINTRAAVRV